MNSTLLRFLSTACLGFLAAKGGAQSNTFPSSGNVGIGTTGPSAKLEVDPGASAHPAIFRMPRYYYFNLVGSEATNSAAGIAFTTTNGNGQAKAGYLTQGSDHGLWILTDSTPRLVVTSTGLLGFGNSSPAAGIQVGKFVQNADGSAEYARFGPSGTGLGPANDWESRVTIRGTGTNSEGRSTLRLEQCSVGEWVGKLSLNGCNTSDIPTANGGLGDSLQLFSESSNPIQFGTANTARMTILANGNVGIGTTNPLRGLSVNGGFMFQAPGGAARTIHWADETTGNAPITIGGSSTAGNEYLCFGTSTFGNWAVERMRITAAGNVGIGTTNPYAPFEVSISGANNSVTLGQYLGRRTAGVAGAGMGVSSRFYLQDAGGSLIETNGIASVWTDPSTAVRTARMDFYSSKNNVSYVAMSLDGSGNVGIGTTNPTNKLEVNGTIRTKEVIVETNGWADHVLAKGYPLAPLSEVEAHIAAKGTLPGIPSAAEVAANGVSVGDMQAKLLAKLEELTLHVIEQEKRLNAQSVRITQLETENAALRVR